MKKDSEKIVKRFREIKKLTKSEIIKAYLRLYKLSLTKTRVIEGLQAAKHQG